MLGRLILGAGEGTDSALASPVGETARADCGRCVLAIRRRVDRGA